jgi:large subunit ribosomal protein L24
LFDGERIMQIPRPVTKPSKQRKAVYQAPAHVRHRLLAAHLSPQLRASHLIRNLPVRTGDTVKVMRGDHKNVEGKISRVDLGKYRIYVEGLTREKVDGTTVFVPIHPSKVMITRLNLDDKWRREILEAKKKSLKKIAKVEEKPKAKRVKPEEEHVEIEAAKEAVEELEEKPEEVVEKAEKVVEEKLPVKVKPAKKRVAEAKKPPARRAATGKAKPKTKVEEAETPEKPKEKKKPKPTKKVSKKTKEGEE